MRLNSFYMICVLLAMVGRTFADNLSIEGVTLQAGEARQVAIVLNNPDKLYAAFQFDLVLPAGVTIAKNEKGKFVTSLNAERADDHTLNVSQTGIANPLQQDPLQQNTYRFMSFSMTNTAFSGMSGVLLYVTLTADADFGPSSQAILTSQVFTEPDGTQHKWEDTVFSIGEAQNKCATPTIIYNKGRLRFESTTPGARFVSKVTTADVQESEEQELQLSTRYVVTVYAVADGYADSDVATATITWGDGTMTAENVTIEGTRNQQGDVNLDSSVDIADIATLISIIAAQK